MTSNDLAATIHYYRKQSGLSQIQLAQLAGVGKTVIYDLEKAKPTIQLNTLLKILSVLNIELKLIPPFAAPAEEKA